jgi:hypothetical protein
MILIKNQEEKFSVSITENTSETLIEEPSNDN